MFERELSLGLSLFQDQKLVKEEMLSVPSN